MSKERWLLLHSKGQSQDELEDLRTQIIDFFAKHDREIELTLGKEDFDARATNLGGWSPWAMSLASSRLNDGSPRYEGFIIPGYPAPPSQLRSQIHGLRFGPIVGKPTFAIVRSALLQNKTVALFDSRSETMTAVVRVERTLDESYARWGRCFCEPAE